MSSDQHPSGFNEPTGDQPLRMPIQRRSFFKYAGATAGATALILAGCSKDVTVAPAAPVNLGAGDVGVLNLAYALEQLEAAFYAVVMAATGTGLSATETTYFGEIANHEAIHRDFLKAAINRDFPGKLLQDLTPNFTNIDFTKRTKLPADTKLGILDAAKAFEDLGVAAYNGAGMLFKSPAYLLLAGQIVSVEARHAAFIRDLILPGSFAADDQIDPTTGLDKALTPVLVLAAVQPYIVQQLDASSAGV